MLSAEKKAAIAELVSFLNNNNVAEVASIATNDPHSNTSKLAAVWLQLMHGEEINSTYSDLITTPNELTNELYYCVDRIATLQRTLDQPASMIEMHNIVHELRLLLIHSIVNDLIDEPESVLAYLMKYCTAFITAIDTANANAEFALHRAIVILVEFKRYASTLHIEANRAVWDAFVRLKLANGPQEFLMAHMRLYDANEEFLQFMQDLNGDLAPTLNSIYDFYAREEIKLQVLVDMHPMIAAYNAWYDSNVAQQLNDQAEPYRIPAMIVAPPEQVAQASARVVPPPEQVEQVQAMVVPPPEQVAQTPEEMLIAYLLESNLEEYIDAQGDTIKLDPNKLPALRVHLQENNQARLLGALDEFEQSQQSWFGWAYNAAKAKVSSIWQTPAATVVIPPAHFEQSQQSWFGWAYNAAKTRVSSYWQTPAATDVVPPAHNAAVNGEEERRLPGRVIRL